ncbi:MAG TPA: hypothetical protein VJB57_10770 [Dehalococcoidia bacterium]|nr:hypothetical protein [Dehalococcoidia bacterium]
MVSLSSFPADVAAQLQWYVYRLIDPRNGETFYVGKGKGNRVFAHSRAEQSLDGDPVDNKLKRIREIVLAGLEVLPVIHRHALDERTAFEIEASLIDAYPGLTNIAGGTGSDDYGPMHVAEIIRRYGADPADFKHKALMITVNRTVGERSLYEATRYAWKVSLAKARQAEVVLATVEGLIQGAFIAEQWLPGTPENFPGREEAPDRLGFVGREAPPEIWQRYVGKRVPNEYRKRGAANPIRYSW